MIVMTTAVMNEPSAIVPRWCRSVRMMLSDRRKCETSLVAWPSSLLSMVGVKYHRETAPATDVYWMLENHCGPTNRE